MQAGFGRRRAAAAAAAFPPHSRLQRRCMYGPTLAPPPQDLTTNNVLVDDTGEEPRLLLIDPAMARPIDLLQRPDRRAPAPRAQPNAPAQLVGLRPPAPGRHLDLVARPCPASQPPPTHLHTGALRRSSGNVTATGWWGSMRARNLQFDPKADLYSLSMVMLEVGGRWVWFFLVGCWLAGH